MFNHRLNASAIDILRRQFTDVGPMFSLAARLVASGHCSSCIDNTDGIAQSLFEIAENSDVAIVIDASKLNIPGLVSDIAAIAGDDAMRLALAAGADFSLVGTIQSNSHSDGVHLLSGADLQSLNIGGWNYYA